jgi:hypothetical protein
LRGLIALPCCSLVFLSSAAAEPDFWGRVHSGTYGETTYELIPDIELLSHPKLVAHPYEVRIPNTEFGNMIVCQLFDVEGEVLTTQTDNSRTGETRMYFTERTSDVSAKCAYVLVERLTRPSTGP